jgi:Uma2 family endonuclease
MATKPAPRRWTYAEYARLPDDGKRYEVIAGELSVSPSPGPMHQKALMRLSTALDQFTQEHGLGEMYHGPINVLLSSTDYLVPDLVFVRAERTGIITRRGIEAAPDLVIEAISPSTAMRDRGPKRERYAHFGVPLYWVVDVELRHIEVYRLSPDSDVPAEIVRDALVWQPVPGGPSLTIAVPSIVSPLGRRT